MRDRSQTLLHMLLQDLRFVIANVTVCLLITADFQSAKNLNCKVFLFICRITTQVKRSGQTPYFFLYLFKRWCFCSYLMYYSGLRTQRFLLWRRAHPVGRWVRPDVPQRLWEGGEATQRGAAATEGAGATEGDWWKREVWANLMIRFLIALVSGHAKATGLVFDFENFFQRAFYLPSGHIAKWILKNNSPCMSVLWRIHTCISVTVGLN